MHHLQLFDLGAYFFWREVGLHVEQVSENSERLRKLYLWEVVRGKNGQRSAKDRDRDRERDLLRRDPLGDLQTPTKEIDTVKRSTAVEFHIFVQPKAWRKLMLTKRHSVNCVELSLFAALCRSSDTPRTQLQRHAPTPALTAFCSSLS